MLLGNTTTLRCEQFAINILLISVFFKKKKNLQLNNDLKMQGNVGFLYIKDYNLDLLYVKSARR